MFPREASGTGLDPEATLFLQTDISKVIIGRDGISRGRWRTGHRAVARRWGGDHGAPGDDQFHSRGPCRGVHVPRVTCSPRVTARRTAGACALCWGVHALPACGAFPRLVGSWGGGWTTWSDT